ncbi:MAG: hypothetical protein LCI00_03705 [Chloroflexi bacterium]|nr:hypothetical protein [Chloroflexota bacterium]MCC6891273.1 hypothetical protein [Anaerolineae bacterium]
MPRKTLNTLILVFLLIALIGYVLPWIVTPANGMQMGAYDLAEWSSLVPSVRQTAPFLWISLALRLPLAIIGFLLSIVLSIKNFRIAVAALVIMSIALLPPLEFFTTYHDDPNYRQQFIIAASTLLIGIASIKRSLNTKKWLVILFSILGTIAGIVGMSQGWSLMQNYKLPMSIGIGMVATTVGFATIAGLGILKQSRT